MGLFDGLRDAATLRGYDTAAKKGDLEAQAAAVVAVNRLGTEGLQRIDPAKAQEVALKAMDRIAFTGTDIEANASAKSALEGWLTAGKVSPLSDTKTGSEAEYRYGAAFSLSDSAVGEVSSGKVSSIWDQMREREGFRAVMFENAPAVGSKLHHDVIYDARDYATKMGREGIKKYPADERAAYLSVTKVIAARATAEMEAQRDAELEAQRAAEYDAGIVRDFNAKDVESAGSALGGDIFASTASFKDGFHYGLEGPDDEGAPDHERAWDREAYPTREAAYDAAQVCLEERERWDAEMLAARHTESKPDRTPADDAAFSRSAAPAPSPDFRAALTAGTSGPARGPR